MQRRVSSVEDSASTLSEVYEYGERGRLTPGTRFKVSRGPYYIAASGPKYSMAEKGIFEFHAYDPRGFILAYRVEKGHVGGISVLYVGKTRKAKGIEGFVERAYKIRTPRGQRGQAVAVDESVKKGQCAEHRTYRGLRRPRGGCVECWAIYNEKNPGKVKFPIKGQKPSPSFLAVEAKMRAGGKLPEMPEKGLPRSARRALANKALKQREESRATVDPLVRKAIEDRKARGLTGAAYGALLGVSGAAVSMLENGKVGLSKKMREKLLTLGVK